MTSTRRAIDEAKRRYALECLRLQADCMQLAATVRKPDLQSHFVRAARVWLTMAESPLDANAGREQWPAT